MDDNKFLEKCVKKAYKINKAFWNFDIKFNVRSVLTRKDMDKEWEGKTQKWMVAFAWNKKLIIFAPSVYEKLGCHKLESYQDTVTHEMNHLFYQKFVGTYKPLWLSEGLATNIQKEMNIKIKKINPDFLLYTEKGWHKKSYEHSYLAVKLLLDKLGKKKLLHLLKKYSKSPKKDNYTKLFGPYLKVF